MTLRLIYISKVVILLLLFFQLSNISSAQEAIDTSAIITIDTLDTTFTVKNDVIPSTTPITVRNIKRALKSPLAEDKLIQDVLDSLRTLLDTWSTNRDSIRETRLIYKEDRSWSKIQKDSIKKIIRNYDFVINSNLRTIARYQYMINYGDSIRAMPDSLITDSIGSLLDSTLLIVDVDSLNHNIEELHDKNDSLNKLYDTLNTLSSHYINDIIFLDSIIFHQDSLLLLNKVQLAFDSLQRKDVVYLITKDSLKRQYRQLNLEKREALKDQDSLTTNIKVYHEKSDSLNKVIDRYETYLIKLKSSISYNDSLFHLPDTFYVEEDSLIITTDTIYSSIDSIIQQTDSLFNQTIDSSLLKLGDSLGIEISLIDTVLDLVDTLGIDSVSKEIDIPSIVDYTLDHDTSIFTKNVMIVLDKDSLSREIENTKTLKDSIDNVTWNLLEQHDSLNCHYDSIITNLQYGILKRDSIIQDYNTLIKSTKKRIRFEPFIKGLEIKADYGKIINWASSYEHKFEWGAAIQFRRNIIIAAEFGEGSIDPKQAYKNATLYHIEGTYYKVGLNYMINISPIDYLHIGFRYGKSTVHDEGSFENGADPWNSFITTVKRENIEATWSEIFISSEKEFVSNIYFGFTFSIRKLRNFTDFAPINIYTIPGYGRTSDSSLPAINLYVKYRLPIRPYYFPFFKE